MELIMPHNPVQFSKFKYILLNIVSIISYFFFIFCLYDKNPITINDYSLLKKTSSLNKTSTNKEISFSNLKTYNNNFFSVSREKFLYESQKKLIFSSLSEQMFEGSWKSINLSEKESGESLIYFEKALERKSGLEALAIEIKNKQGKYIDSWTKTISFTKYKSLNKKIDLLKKTFDISGIYMTQYEKGEIFETKFKQEKCIGIINITFPLGFIDINATTLNGNKIYLGKMGYPDNNNFTMKFRSNCGIGFDIKANIIDIEKNDEEKQNKIFIYFFLCLFSTVLYGVGGLFLFYGIKNNEGYLSCFNIELFSLNSVWNFYCCISNIYIAFNTNFNFFVFLSTIGLCSILKLFAFDSIIYSVYWKIKERRITRICQLIKIKLRFYLFLCSCLILCFFFMPIFFVNYYCILLISFILWFPQILYNIISFNRYSFPFIFILANSIDRLIYPFYFRAYKNNYFELETNIYIFILALIIIISNVIILLIQSYAGPRFMLPKKYQEKTNEYYKELDEIKNFCKDINEECVICLMPIYQEGKIEMVEMKENNNSNEDDITNEEKLSESNMSNNIEDNNINDDKNLLIKEENSKNEKTEVEINNQNNQDRKCLKIFKKTNMHIKEFFKYNFFYFYKSSSNINNKPYILTPCKHVFHSDCLDKWLEVKRECPNCRTSLDKYFDY